MSETTVVIFWDPLVEDEATFRDRVDAYIAETRREELRILEREVEELRADLEATARIELSANGPVAEMADRTMRDLTERARHLARLKASPSRR